MQQHAITSFLVGGQTKKSVHWRHRTQEQARYTRSLMQYFVEYGKQNLSELSNRHHHAGLYKIQKLENS